MLSFCCVQKGEHLPNGRFMLVVTRSYEWGSWHRYERSDRALPSTQDKPKVGEATGAGTSDNTVRSLSTKRNASFNVQESMFPKKEDRWRTMASSRSSRSSLSCILIKSLKCSATSCGENRKKLRTGLLALLRTEQCSQLNPG